MQSLMAKLGLGAAALLWAAASLATNWSQQTHDVYTGHFNNDTRADLLVIARDPAQLSGIFTSDGAGVPSTQLQSWHSSFLGINWHSGHYVAIVGNFDGQHGDDVLLQHKDGGTSYLITSNAQGQLESIHQYLTGWGAASYRILAGDFNGDGRADAFLQARASSGTNYVVLSDGAGQLTNTSHSFGNDHLGFKWSAQNALVHVGDFNGDSRDDLLVQAKPEIVLIDFDIPIPVPVSKPQSFGLTLATAAGQFTSIHQLWSRRDFGVDWAPNAADIVIGDYNGDGRDDVFLVARHSGQLTHVVLTDGNGQLQTSATQTLTPGAAGTHWTAADYRMLAADFNGDGRSELYQQAPTPGGTNHIVSFTSAGTVSSVGAHDTPPITTVEVVTYTYDARGRLKQVQRSGGVNDNVHTQYTYDKADNRSTVVTTGSSNPPP